MVFVVVVVAVVWVAPATVVVAVQVVPVAQAALTTSRVEEVVVNHRMAEPAASLEPALLLVAIPVVRGLS